MLSPVRVIITGGTIDAEAYPDPKNPPAYATMLQESPVPAALETLGMAAQCHCFIWMRKDSQHFSQEEMAALARIIDEQVDERHVLITHGTDSMAENSILLAQALQARGCTKTVVFTGAMMPLANGSHSDGYANLRYALKHITQQKPGVYIMMHGDIFMAGEAHKDRELKRFIKSEQ